MSDTKTVRCKKCGRRIRNDSLKKWKHVVRYHPEIALSKLVPLALNPDRARDVGAEFGRGYLRWLRGE